MSSIVMWELFYQPEESGFAKKRWAAGDWLSCAPMILPWWWCVSVDGSEASTKDRSMVDKGASPFGFSNKSTYSRTVVRTGSCLLWWREVG